MTYVAVLAVSAILPAVHGQTPLGTAFSYQGQLKQNGGPVSGTVDLQFRLWDAAGTGNPPTGGTQIGTAQTVNDVQAANGLFTVTLNAAGEFGTSAFNGDARWLEIGVRPGTSTGAYTVLSPRQAVTPAPYAIRAMNSPGLSLPFSATFNVPDSEGIPAFQVIDQVNESAALHGKSTGSDGNGVFAESTGTYGFGLYAFANGGLGRAVYASTSGGAITAVEARAVGTPPQGQHNTGGYFTATGSESVGVLGEASWGLHGKTTVSGGRGVFGQAAPTVGTAAGVHGESSAGTGVFGYASATTGTQYGVWGRCNSPSGYGLYGHNDSSTGPAIGVYGSVHPSNTQAYGGWFQGHGYFAGNLGIGVNPPTSKLDVAGTAKMTGFQLGTSTTAGYVLTASAAGVGTWQAVPSLSLPYSGSGADTVAAFKVTNTSSGAGLYGSGTGYGVRGDGGTGGVFGFTNSGSGVYGSATLSGGIGLKGKSTVGPGVYAEGSGTGTANPAIYVTNTNANGIGVFSTCTSTDANAVFVNKGTGDIVKGFSGSTGGNLVFRVQNNGTTTVSALAITGGADLSEQFDVNAAETEPAPGLVVCIDPDHAGKLVVSSKPYDRTVAGVISGAGGVATGMTMGHSGTVADGRHPVALTGRVYVRADATKGAIEPGDLLTTSGVPGHAMKVADYERSRGATLGKAMSRLAEGHDLVLMLVQPQ